jgi:hypothetical protein
MQNPLSKPSRRGFFAGAAAAGAVVAVAAKLAPTAPSGQAVDLPRPAPEKGGGYSVSEHVKRYYKTTLV